MEELATVDKSETEIEFFWILEGEFEGDDERVVDLT